MSERRTQSRAAVEGVIDSLISGWDSETLFQAREDFERLLDDPGFLRLLSLLDQAKENGTTRLIQGPIQDQAGYTRSLGILYGIDVVREIPRLVKKHADRIEQRAAERDREEAISHGR